MSSWWSEPVRVSMNGRTAVNVTSNERAAELLLSDWPESDLSFVARKAVLRAMEHPDLGTAYVARQAFTAAAEDAGFLLPGLPKSLADEGSKSHRWRKRKA